MKRKEAGVMASYFGKYANIVPTEEGISIYIVSAFLLLAPGWLLAAIMFSISLLFDPLAVNIIMTVAGAILGWFLAVRYYRGRLKFQIRYEDLSALIFSKADFMISKKSDKDLLALRLLPKRQEKLIAMMRAAIEKNGRYVLERKGKSYYISAKETL